MTLGALPGATDVERIGRITHGGLAGEISLDVDVGSAELILTLGGGDVASGGFDGVVGSLIDGIANILGDVIDASLVVIAAGIRLLGRGSSEAVPRSASTSERAPLIRLAAAFAEPATRSEPDYLVNARRRPFQKVSASPLSIVDPRVGPPRRSPLRCHQRQRWRRTRGITILRPSHIIIVRHPVPGSSGRECAREVIGTRPRRHRTLPRS